MAENDGVEVIQTLCTSTGPGSASLASTWASSFGLTNVQVWGDTTDYMYSNFGASIGGSYPNTLVVDIDTMEITYFGPGDVTAAQSAVDAILATPDPCAE